MRFYASLIMVAMTVLLQVLFGHGLSVFGAVPLVVLCVLLVGFDRWTAAQALIAALLAGVLLDVFSWLPFGIHLVPLLVVTGLVYFVLNRFFDPGSRPWWIIMTIGATVLTMVMQWGILRIWQWEQSGGLMLPLIIGLAIVYHAVLVGLIVIARDRIENRQQTMRRSSLRL